MQITNNVPLVHILKSLKSVMSPSSDGINYMNQSENAKHVINILEIDMMYKKLAQIL